MIQAWLALPALAAAYLLAAPAAKLRTRCAHVALAGLVTAVVSLFWMTAVSLVPSQHRPYVDGSPDDSVYTQVFDYNGLGRLTGNWATLAGPPSPLLVAAEESGRLLNAKTMGIRRAGTGCWPARSRRAAGGCCRRPSSARWACSSPGAARAGATRCAPPSCCGAAGG